MRLRTLTTALIVLSLAACSTPTPKIIKETVIVTQHPLPTYTPYPTQTPYSTQTPYPTYTVHLPTRTPTPSTADTVLTVTACTSGPLFAATSVVLVVVLFSYRRKTKAENEKAARESETQKQALLAKIGSLNHLVERLKSDAFRLSRDRWLKNISRNRYRNEIEVEVNFVHPLLRYLGYDDGSYELRVPVTLQVGRNQSTVQADWVIWGKPGTGGTRSAHIVIEAKGPDQVLDEVVQQQARSYAYGLNAPYYVLTNGTHLQVYGRGVQGDTCLIDCRVGELFEKWVEVEQVIGASKQQ